MFIGPVFGAILYSTGGISVVFLAFGSAILLLNILLLFALKENGQTSSLEESLLNQDDYIEDEDIEATHALLQEEADHNEVNISKLLNSKTTITLFATVAVVMAAFGFPDSIIAIRLVEIDFSRSEIGIFYAFGLSSYVLSSLFVNKILAHTNHKGLITISLIMCISSCIILGPSQILPFAQESKIQLFMGLASLYFFLPFALIPMLELIINYYTEKYSHLEENALRQTLSSLYKFCYGVGEVSGPLLSGAIYSLFNFQMSCDIMAAALLSITICFYLFVPNSSSSCNNSRATHTNEAYIEEAMHIGEE